MVVLIMNRRYEYRFFNDNVKIKNYERAELKYPSKVSSKAHSNLIKKQTVLLPLIF